MLAHREQHLNVSLPGPRLGFAAQGVLPLSFRSPAGRGSALPWLITSYPMPLSSRLAVWLVNNSHRNPVPTSNACFTGYTV